MSRKLSINYFSPQILQISQIFILSDCVELKKTSKTPLVMAEVYRPDVLSFRPVPESVLKPLLTPFPYQGNSNVPKLSPHSGKNIKNSAHGWMSACCPLLPLVGFFLRYATKAAKPSEGW